MTAVADFLSILISDPSYDRFIRDDSHADVEQALADNSATELLARDPTIRYQVTQAVEVFSLQEKISQEAYARLKELLGSLENGVRSVGPQELGPWPLRRTGHSFTVDSIGAPIKGALKIFRNPWGFAQKHQIPENEIVQVATILARAITGGKITNGQTLYAVRMIDDVLLSRLEGEDYIALVKLRDALFSLFNDNARRAVLILSGFVSAFGWKLEKRQSAGRQDQTQKALMTVSIREQPVTVQAMLKFSPEGVLTEIGFEPEGKNLALFSQNFVAENLMKVFTTRYPTVQKVALHFMGHENFAVWQRRKKAKLSPMADKGEAAGTPGVGRRVQTVVSQPGSSLDAPIGSAQVAMAPLPLTAEAVLQPSILFHIVGAAEMASAQPVFGIVGAAEPARAYEVPENDNSLHSIPLASQSPLAFSMIDGRTSSFVRPAMSLFRVVK